MIWLNNLIVQLLPLVPKSIIRIFAKQYIAGEKLQHALQKIKELNTENISATLDLLGEDPKKRRDCITAVNIYKTAIKEIHDQKLESGVSLKPSQMGIKIDKQFCFDNIHTIVSHAEKYNIFVRIDMEDASLKQDTVDFYLKLNSEFPNVGIVMQAYLRTAIHDVKEMVENKANIRLCKGAYYWEDAKIVYKDMSIINSSYVYLLEKLLENNCFTGIATHDEKLVFEAMKIVDRLNAPKQGYEFQMLYGVQKKLLKIIQNQGYPVRIYVPFGKQWFAYSLRRLKENPKIVSYIFSNAVKGIFIR